MTSSTGDQPSRTQYRERERSRPVVLVTDEPLHVLVDARRIRHGLICIPAERRRPMVDPERLVEPYFDAYGRRMLSNVDLLRAVPESLVEPDAVEETSRKDGGVDDDRSRRAAHHLALQPPKVGIVGRDSHVGPAGVQLSLPTGDDRVLRSSRSRDQRGDEVARDDDVIVRERQVARGDEANAIVAVRRQTLSRSSDVYEWFSQR